MCVWGVPKGSCRPQIHQAWVSICCLFDLIHQTSETHCLSLPPRDHIKRTELLIRDVIEILNHRIMFFISRFFLNIRSKRHVFDTVLLLLTINMCFCLHAWASMCKKCWTLIWFHWLRDYLGDWLCEKWDVWVVFFIQNHVFAGQRIRSCYMI